MRRTFYLNILAAAAISISVHAAGRGTDNARKPKVRKFHEYFHNSKKVKRIYTAYLTRNRRRILHGYDVSFHSNRRKRMRSVYRHGKRQGESRSWYRGGALKSYGVYANNTRDGLWMTLYTDGSKKRETEFAGGKLHGTVKEWHSNGKSRFIGSYEVGKKTGEHTSRYKNGKLKRRWTYVDETLSGPAQEWFSDGKKKFDGTYTDGKETGVHTVWFKNGQMASQSVFKDGILNGKVRIWFKNGEPKEQAGYTAGKLVGNRTRWNADGDVIANGIYRDAKPYEGLFLEAGTSLKNFYVTVYKKGVATDGMAYEDGEPKHGEHIDYYSSGERLRMSYYKNGKKQGLEFTWYNTGAKLSECTWVDNKLDGLYIEWYPNGSRKREIHLKAGQKDGIERSWESDKHLLTFGEYKDDIQWNGWLMVQPDPAMPPYLAEFENGKIITKEAELPTDASKEPATRFGKMWISHIIIKDPSGRIIGSTEYRREKIKKEKDEDEE